MKKKKYLIGFYLEIIKNSKFSETNINSLFQIKLNWNLFFIVSSKIMIRSHCLFPTGFFNLILQNIHYKFLILQYYENQKINLDFNLTIHYSDLINFVKIIINFFEQKEIINIKNQLFQILISNFKIQSHFPKNYLTFIESYIIFLIDELFYILSYEKKKFYISGKFQFSRYKNFYLKIFF